jgi:hypothetical protein
MSPPDFFQLKDGYAIFRPLAEVTLEQAVDMTSAAIAFCRDHDIRRILVDITKLSGFGPPSTVQRFLMAERFAADAQSRVIGALVAKPDFIDPQRFGVTVARNRGLINNVFTCEAEAVKWLLAEEGM